VQEKLTHAFIEKNDENLPLTIYILKLLNQHLDLQIILKSTSEILPWLCNLEFPDYNEF
jgi:hypothetical protein